MSTWRPLTSVFHPTDFSPESEVAFLHALRLALSLSAQLRIMHVAETKEYAHWSEFPQVRATLAAWGLLRPDAERNDVAQLGLGVEKILAVDEHPKDAILTQLQFRPATLMVLATYQLSALARWASETIAEPVARQSGVPALFIPAGCNGFVSRTTGAVDVEQVLIPISHSPAPQLGIDAAEALATILRLQQVVFRLLYIGTDEEFPIVHLPRRAEWTWERVIRQGPVVSEILTEATQQGADLLIMTTDGHVGFADALFGSTTEQVVRQIPCPLFAIPGDPTVITPLATATGVDSHSPTPSVSSLDIPPTIEVLPESRVSQRILEEPRAS